MKARLKWRGKHVLKQLTKNTDAGLAKFTIAVANDAKDQLYPGHGVDTRTLQKSIHAASADYPWPRDDVEPDAFTPERGGHRVLITTEGNKRMASVGSGQKYAFFVHQLYDYITHALVKNMPHVARFFRTGP